MGNNNSWGLVISKKLGTKEFDNLWNTVAGGPDGVLNHEKALKIMKKLGSMLGVSYDDGLAESILAKISSDSDYYTAGQFKQLLFLVAENKMTNSLKGKKSSVFGASWCNGDCALVFGAFIRILRFLEEQNATQIEGIFRISGDSVKIEELANSFNVSADPLHNPIDPSHYSIHDVAGTLKLLFRLMPEPLFPYGSYNDILEGAREKEPEKQQDIIVSILERLPKFNATVLFYLINCLQTIHKNNSVNSMTAANLATCFAPTLIKNKVDDQMAMLSETELLIKFVIEIISNPFYVQKLQNKFSILEDYHITYEKISQEMIRSESTQELPDTTVLRVASPRISNLTEFRRSPRAESIKRIFRSSRSHNDSQRGSTELSPYDEKRRNDLSPLDLSPVLQKRQSGSKTRSKQTITTTTTTTTTTSTSEATSITNSEELLFSIRPTISVEKPPSTRTKYSRRRTMTAEFEFLPDGTIVTKKNHSNRQSRHDESRRVTTSTTTTTTTTTTTVKTSRVHTIDKSHSLGTRQDIFHTSSSEPQLAVIDLLDDTPVPSALSMVDSIGDDSGGDKGSLRIKERRGSVGSLPLPSMDFNRFTRKSRKEDRSSKMVSGGGSGGDGGGGTEKSEN